MQETSQNLDLSINVEDAADISGTFGDEFWCNPGPVKN